MVILDVNGAPFRFYEMGMKFSGVWPLHRNQRRSMIVFSITTLVQIVIVVTCLLHPLKECLPFRLRRAHSFRIVLTVVGMLSQISLRVYGRSMIPLIEKTIADWSTITGSRERDILKRHNRAGLYFFFSVIAYSIALEVLYLKKIPFVDEFIFMEKSEDCASTDMISSNLLSILTIIAIGFSRITALSGLLLFWSLVMHLSARFKILKEQFQDFLLIKVKAIRRKEFRKLVESHNQLLDLSGHIENSFTFFVAIHVMKLQIMICMQSFWIASKIDEIFSIATLNGVVDIGLVAVMIYIYYYAGDYLSVSSEEIGDVFTQCNWYNLSKESIKDYSIVIARCQKPCTLTCAKTYKLNLSNLRYVFNAMYSYVMCIAAVVRATLVLGIMDSSGCVV